MQGIFATAINCMDGRVQKPVFNFICANYGVDFIDMITEPGPIKILSENHDKFTIESLRLKTALSIDKHKSNLIAIIGHHDCAGNPVSEKVQRIQLLHSVNFIRGWNFSAEVIGLWVNENWEVSTL